MAKKIGRFVSKTVDTAIVAVFSIIAGGGLIYLVQLIWLDPVVFLKIVGTIGIVCVAAKLFCILNDLIMDL